RRWSLRLEVSFWGDGAAEHAVERPASVLQQRGTRVEALGQLGPQALRLGLAVGLGLLLLTGPGGALGVTGCDGLGEVAERVPEQISRDLRSRGERGLPRRSRLRVRPGGLRRVDEPARVHRPSLAGLAAQAPVDDGLDGQ